MSKKKNKPGKIYQILEKSYPKVFEGVESLGKAVRGAGPLDEKTGQLIQLAAAAATGSEGAVHSHIRRASKAGASAEEIQHTLLLLISTIGFPQTMAALSWSRDILDADKE